MPQSIDEPVSPVVDDKRVRAPSPAPSSNSGQDAVRLVCPRPSESLHVTCSLSPRGIGSRVA